jgi:hypothetical protein
MIAIMSSCPGSQSNQTFSVAGAALSWLLRWVCLTVAALDDAQIGAAVDVLAHARDLNVELSVFTP